MAAKPLIVRKFAKLLQEAAEKNKLKENAIGSMNWYRKKVSMSMERVKPQNILAYKDRLRKFINYGNMYFFRYDPKYKKILPYYDEFPCIIVVDKGSSWFTGINLHYLPYIQRGKLLDGLMSIASDQKYNDRTKIRVTYDFLKQSSKTRFFKPCYKKYLVRHLRSPLVRIKSIEWPIATFIPVERFVKKTKTHVWRDSLKAIR